MKTLEMAALCAAGLSLLTLASAHAQKTAAGSRHEVRLACPAERFAGATGSEPKLIWREVIHHPGASYIAVHFAAFALGPSDYITVGSPAAGDRGEVLRQVDAGSVGRWARRIQGDTAVLELFAASGTRERQLDVDLYTAGYQGAPGIESLIGWNNLENVACHQGTLEYEKAKAVARLLVHSIDGDYWGTGFLVSPQGHLLTARHLVSDTAEAASAEYDFMAEAPGCGDYNGEGDWSGVTFRGSELVKVGSGRDFTLVRVTGGNPASQFGFLELEEGRAVVGEAIYIPQHAGGRGKQIAIYSDSANDTAGICRVQSLTADPCGGEGHDVGYYADTEGGSSGSPVLSRATHRVLAMHHCGGEMNTGVPSRDILGQISCAIGVTSVDRTGAEPGETGGDVLVQVNGCSWTISNPCSEWVQVSPLTGAGLKTVTVSVSTNYDCRPRSCEIWMGGNLFRVNQAAGRGIASVYPRSATFGHAGGPGTIEVAGDPSCGWTPSSDSDWLLITGVIPGEHKVTINYTVAPALLASPRSGSIVMAGWPHTVVQTPPVLTPIPGMYNGLFQRAGGVTQTRSGFVKLTVTAKATFSGSLQIGSRRYAVSGPFEPGGMITTKVISRGKEAPLTLRLAPPRPDALVGTVGDDTWTADFTLHRAIYNGRTNVAPEAGSYTVVVEGQEGSAAFPAGSGYGLVKIDRTGRVKLTGSLADGTRISQSAYLGPQGQWPLYIPLYSGKGSLQGQLLVKTDREVDGHLNWTKPPLPTAKYYPGGFEIQTHATGCGFSGTVYDAKVLPFTDGELTVSEGALPGSLTAFFKLLARSKVVQTGGPRLSISFSSSSGLMTGRVLEPFSSKWLSFKGVVLQRAKQASGYFLKDGQSGKVTVNSSESSNQ